MDIMQGIGWIRHKWHTEHFWDRCICGHTRQDHTDERGACICIIGPADPAEYEIDLWKGGDYDCTCQSFVFGTAYKGKT